jgi:hypothetical protein
MAQGARRRARPEVVAPADGLPYGAARLATALAWILRATVAAGFVGYGIAGVRGNPARAPSFTAVGVPAATALTLMPLVALGDVAVAAFTLLFPIRAVLLCATVWGAWTNLLRPLAGQGIWEAIARGGSLGAPLALLYLTGPARSLADWVARRPVPRLDATRGVRLAWILRVAIASLLVGHRAFGAVEHLQTWTGSFALLGIDAATVHALRLAPLVGAFELLLGLAVLCEPAQGLLVFVLGWELCTEALRPLAGEPVWQVVERAADYGAPVALIVLQRWLRRETAARLTPWPTGRVLGVLACATAGVVTRALLAPRAPSASGSALPLALGAALTEGVAAGLLLRAWRALALAPATYAVGFAVLAPLVAPARGTDPGTMGRQLVLLGALVAAGGVGGTWLAGRRERIWEAREDGTIRPA